MNGIAEDSIQQKSLLYQIRPTTAAGVADIAASGAGSTVSPQSSPPSSSSREGSSTTTTFTIPINASEHVVNDKADTGFVQLTLGAMGGGVPVQSHQVKVASPEHKEPLVESEIGPQPALEHIKEEGEVALEHVNGQIEPLEHTPDSLIGSGDAAGLVTEDGQEWIPDSDHELKRVKVYELVGSRWIDQGTAFCFGQFQEETNEALLIARSERNYNDVILSTAIRSNDVYQRQQDTLIVWTEPDGVDYALSFQDPEGCAEVWNFILEVQRHMNSTGARTSSSTLTVSTERRKDDPSAISSSPLLGPDTSVTTSSIIRSGHLPPPQLGIIGEIERAIKALSRTAQVKERICEYIQQEDYIKSLIEVMNTAEDLGSLENLHALCSLIQTILMLNDHSLYEHILEDDLFFGVVGMLEYDPDFPGHKANYREFLHQISRFHQPIPIHDISIQRKIHHTYRLQFLKDVVLARALDDSTFNVLNSCIIFNQIDIIQHVQQDPVFLRDIVCLFVDVVVLLNGNKKPQQPANNMQNAQGQVPPQQIIISLNGNGDSDKEEEMDVDQRQQTSPKLPNGTLPPSKSRAYYMTHYAFSPPDNLTSDEINLRREVIILIQQLCVMGKNVQLPARMALFRSLVDRGVLFAVQWALSLPEKEEANKSMIGAAGEVLSALLDHDLNGVRGHALKQISAIEIERSGRKKYADKAETILELCCRIVAQSRDLAIQSQIGDALKTWMEVPAIVERAQPGGASEAAGPPKPTVGNDDPGTERYMDYFYKDCVHILFKPLIELVEWRNVKGSILVLSREETNRFVYLADLLHNFIAQHHFRSHFYVMSSNIISRVASLLKAKDKHLRHASFRIFRLLLKQNNSTSHSQMARLDVLKPILDLTLQESRRDNLLSCSCQEFFDIMRRENMKEMIKFCMTKHETEIRQLAKTPLGGQRFELFIQRWEINNEPPPAEEIKPEKPVDARVWPGQGRGALDAEEEDYFNTDDLEDDTLIPLTPQTWPRGNGGSSSIVSISGLKRKRRAGVGTMTKGYRPPLRTPVLGSLVDYDEDDEETSQANDSTPSEASTSKVGPPTPSPNAPQSSPKLGDREASISALSGSPNDQAKEPDDEEDGLLEGLLQPRARSQSPAPSGVSIGPRRLGGKRRRDEDDDDELLERLRKSKRPDPGGPKDAMLTGNRTKTGDDPPKRIRVKLGLSSLALASPKQNPPPSEVGAKDGDTG